MHLLRTALLLAASVALASNLSPSDYDVRAGAQAAEWKATQMADHTAPQQHIPSTHTTTRDSPSYYLAGVRKVAKFAMEATDQQKRFKTPEFDCWPDHVVNKRLYCTFTARAPTSEQIDAIADEAGKFGAKVIEKSITSDMARVVVSLGKTTGPFTQIKFTYH